MGAPVLFCWSQFATLTCRFVLQKDDLLFLRKGGEVVYHGELGSNSSSIVSYFESKGCTPIELGDNPANWMLRVLETSAKNLVAAYLESKECASIAKKVDDIQNCLDPEMRIQYQNEFACTKLKRFREISRRLRIIYWRSPTYNTTRLLVSLAIAVVLGSAFLGRRDPSVFLESGMRARVSVVFLSFIITGIMAMISVLPVMTKIRDMYYRHRDASMYDSVSIGIALGSAEKWFIVLSTAIFTTSKYKWLLISYGTDLSDKSSMYCYISVYIHGRFCLER